MEVPDPQKLYQENPKEYFRIYYDWLYLRKIDQDYYYGIVYKALMKVFGKANE